MDTSKKNYRIYALMLIIFGLLIYWALTLGEQYAAHNAANAANGISESAFSMFRHIIAGNLDAPLTILLFQVIIILIAVRLFSHLFKRIGQPGVIGEIVAGIVLGPSLLGYFFPDFFNALFPSSSLTNLELLSQIGLILFMFVIGMEVDFSVLKNKMNETLVISHAGIIVPFFLGIVSSFWIYEEYAASQTSFLPFALFIGISMSITAFPVLARIIQERNMTKTPIGVLSIASAANDDVTAWCLLAIVIAVAKAGTFISALYTVGLTLLFIAVMFGVIRPFLRKIGELYANSEVITKTFVGFIFLIMIISAAATEIIGIHALFGAFIAGVVMPGNTGFRKVMMEKVEDIALVFFLPLFFAFTGLRTQIGLINSPELWGICILLIFISILGKLGGCTIAARLVGESWKNSFIVGTLMNTRGLMELVALNIGYEMGVLPPEIFVILILMALTTTFMTTPLLNLVEKLFKAKEQIKEGKLKLLLSFGRPESGKTLLSIAGLLFGRKLQNANIIAAHYTLGTDVNPVKAGQYARDSFRPLDRESARLNLKIDKRYKVTDRLTREISRLVNTEKAEMLFIGAGPQFMQAPALGTVKNLHTSLFFQAMHKIRNQIFRFSGNLMQDKLSLLIENTNSNVAVFVNREYTETRNLYMLINSKEDIQLLSHLSVQAGDYSTPLHLCSLRPLADTEQQQVEDICSGYEGCTAAIETIEGNPRLHCPESLLIMSYKTCKALATDKELFASLPSLLVIHLKSK